MKRKVEEKKEKKEGRETLERGRSMSRMMERPALAPSEASGSKRIVAPLLQKKKKENGSYTFTIFLMSPFFSPKIFQFLSLFFSRPHLPQF